MIMNKQIISTYKNAVAKWKILQKPNPKETFL